MNARFVIQERDRRGAWTVQQGLNDRISFDSRAQAERTIARLRRSGDDSEYRVTRVPVQFVIEARDREPDPPYRYGNWSPHGLGGGPDDNAFDSVADAEAAIESLRALGDDWATAEYRVVERLPRGR